MLAIRLPSQVRQYHYQEIGSATFSGCEDLHHCTYVPARSPWLPAKLPTVSSKMLHNSVCLLHSLHTVLSVVLHIELPYSTILWLVFGLCGMRRVGGEGRGSYSFSPSGAYRGGQSVRGEGRGVGTRVLGNGVRPSDSM